MAIYFQEEETKRKEEAAAATAKKAEAKQVPTEYPSLGENSLAEQPSRHVMLKREV